MVHIFQNLAKGHQKINLVYQRKNNIALHANKSCKKSSRVEIKIQHAGWTIRNIMINVIMVMHE